MTPTEKTKYTASFTLSQTGLEGSVFSKLDLSPRVEEGEEMPVVYEVMSELALMYLQMSGVVDGSGNIKDEEQFLNQTEVLVTPNSRAYA